MSSDDSASTTTHHLVELDSQGLPITSHPIHASLVPSFVSAELDGVDDYDVDEEVAAWRAELARGDDDGSED